MLRNLCFKNVVDPWIGLKLLNRSGVLLLMLVVGLCSGCAEVRFYHQAIAGHLDILARRKAISSLVASPKTPERLRQQLESVLEIRRFAQEQLLLPVADQYLEYADLGRRFAVWNVYAAPEFSIEPKKWFYPFLGRLSYRGYFRKADAESLAGALRSKGFDTYVGGVPAYSTLGWFRDPVLNTFLEDDEVDLAETLFHELAHQKLFVRGDTDFNEAFATAVSEEGVRRWLLSRGAVQKLQEYQARCSRRDEFVDLVIKHRSRLQASYKTNGCKAASGNSSSCSEAKMAIIEELRAEYRDLRKTWGNYRDYDNWFEKPINNAKLNTIDSYYRLVPAFQKLLPDSMQGLKSFYSEVTRLSKLSKAERLAALVNSPIVSER